MLPPGFTLEERARLSEEEAVRRQFDARNLGVLRFASWIFAAIAFGLFFYGITDPGGLKAVIGTAGWLGSAVLVFLIRRAARPPGTTAPRREKLAAIIRRRLRSFTITYLLFQWLFLTLMAFGEEEAPLASATLFVWFLVLIRLLPSQTILLYATGAALSGTALWLGTPGGRELVAPLVVNAVIALAVNLVFTWRARRRFLREWREARVDAVEQIRIREELGFARQIQLSMLPREAPAVEWLAIASLSLPASEVGGDYYDYFPVDEDRFAVVAGDVAGHGLASGLVLSGVRSGLTLLADDLGDPAAVMARLHRMVRQTLQHRMLVTLAILLLDRSTATATLTSAGHPPLFIRRRDGAVERIETSALPLGNGLSDRFAQTTVPFGPGDLFVLQTDGAYEAVNAEGEPFGFARLEAAIAAADGTPPSIRDHLLRAIWEFRGSVPQNDDVTLVVVQVAG
ncbi:MAG: PP2C family protein-serine/threonine phosphatase [Thermoanaerobaculia bacterium]